MPDIYMNVDAALSEVPVNKVPLVAISNFYTISSSVAYNADGLVLVWNFVTTAGVYSQTAVTPTDTGGSYDWVAQGNGMYTIEIPATDPGSGTIWNATEGIGWFTGKTTAELPWCGPTIGFRAAALNALLIDDAYSATRGLAGTALPDAVAGAASGLPLKAAAGDFLNVANLPQVAAGGTNGLLRSGTNSGTTTLAALSITGQLDAGNLLVDGTTALTGAVTAPAGVVISNASGTALSLTSSGGDGNGLAIVGNANGSGVLVTAGSENNGVTILATHALRSGLAISSSGGSGVGINVAAQNGTAIKTMASVAEFDTDITGNITGNLSGSVGTVGADGITAASIAAGAIDAATFAAGAINAAAIADGAIDAATFAAGAINAAAIADAAIDFATFAADCKTGTGLKANVESITADAITAASIAANAIDAATFAVDVDAEARSWLGLC